MCWLQNLWSCSFSFLGTGIMDMHRPTGIMDMHHPTWNDSSFWHKMQLVTSAGSSHRMSYIYSSGHPGAVRVHKCPSFFTSKQNMLLLEGASLTGSLTHRNSWWWPGKVLLCVSLREVSLQRQKDVPFVSTPTWKTFLFLLKFNFFEGTKIESWSVLFLWE